VLIKGLTNLYNVTNIVSERYDEARGKLPKFENPDAESSSNELGRGKRRRKQKTKQSENNEQDNGSDRATEHSEIQVLS
jgi:hypothetical protein